MSYQRISGKRILVTGGAGFIGSNLCEDFLKHDNEVICMDNLSTGYRENMDSFIHHPKFTFIEGDIRQLEDCLKATLNVDIVFHQAAICSVPRSIDDPITSHQANVDGFFNMLVAVKQNSVKRMVYAASSSAYGDSTKLPKVEGEEGKPLSPYALTKLINEQYADVFSKVYGLELIGLRYFNVFGPRQNPNGAYAAVIPKFIQAYLAGESPVINGDGTNSRDFTFIENVIQMNHLAGSTVNMEAFGKVFNTATGLRTTLIQLLEMIKNQMIELNSPIEQIENIYGPKRNGDIPHSWAEIQKAKLYLGYEPKTDLLQQVQKTVIFYTS